MSKRAHINKTTKLAAALLALGDIPYSHSKQMTAAQICSLYAFDHGVLHAVDPIDEAWNLTPRLIWPHRVKSKGDTTTVAKVRRLEKDATDFRRRVLAKPAGHKQPKSGKWRNRPWPTRKMRDRDNTSVPFKSRKD